MNVYGLLETNPSPSWIYMHNYSGNISPTWGSGKLFQDHLFQTLTLVESKYPNCGIIITGDFNRLNVTRLLNHFRLKQIVKIPTRNDATLDLILTNMHKFYNPPQGYQDLGCPIIIQ